MPDVLSDTPPRAPEDLKRTPRQKGGGEAFRIDRTPPQSTEAEQGVLGCILLSPREGLGQSIEKLKAGIPVFYEPRHQTLYDLMIEMYDGQEPIDLVTVSQRLKDRGKLDEVGGIAYLSALTDAVPSAANLSYYAEIVREKYLLRKMIQTCTRIISKTYEQQGQVKELLDEVERDILRISEERVEATLLPIKDLVHKAINTVEDLHARQGRLTGLSTGLPDLDKLTTGLHPGEMVVIAARPSMGKTSIAMNIVEHVAIELKLPVAVFSLEMTADSLVLRMLCSRARVNLRGITQGSMIERDFPRLTLAAGKMSNSRLFIDDTPGLSILDVRARARRLWQQHGVKLFVIDYLQLLHSTAPRAEQNRQQEIADISSGVKSLAKELGVPVIVLSQLNREPERREPGAKPRLSDLRESGSIEQDADVVGLLYKPGSGDEDDARESNETEVMPINLLIAKQRNGPTGDVPLMFHRLYTRFESASNIAAEDLPHAS